MRGTSQLTIVIGNLGADPEVRYMTDGDAVSTLRIATTKTLSRTQLDKDLLNYFHVSGHQKQVLKFESRRQDLNHLTAMTLYEIKRLNDYLSQSRELAILKQANKQENTASHHHLITNKK